MLDLLYELKDSLNKDDRIILLNKIEEELNNDKNVNLLAMKKNRINEEYNELLRFNDENSDIVKNKQKELYLAKKELDELPIVKQYNKAYQDVRLLYEHISKELFDKLNFKKACL